MIAAPFAWQIIRHWDIRSGAERQLMLERRTYLFSTLLGFVFALQLISLLLFVFNADQISGMFVGAMCAVGALNVNDYGFPALICHIVIFFLAAAWLTLNHIDNLAPDYPLVRLKYQLLLLFVPLLGTGFWLEFNYFSGLQANVITSCCGSLFSTESHTLASEASGVEAQSALLLFYSTIGISALLAAWHWRRGSSTSAYLTTIASVAGFVVAIVGILSFLSLYIYEHPHHHCPFCILKPEYHYQGYWLYLPLFIGTASGISTGLIQPFLRQPSLANVIPRVSASLARTTVICWLLVLMVSTGFILSSNLILVE